MIADDCESEAFLLSPAVGSVFSDRMIAGEGRAQDDGHSIGAAPVPLSPTSSFSLPFLSIVRAREKKQTVAEIRSDTRNFHFLKRTCAAPGVGPALLRIERVTPSSGSVSRNGGQRAIAECYSAGRAETIRLSSRPCSSMETRRVFTRWTMTRSHCGTISR